MRPATNIKNEGRVVALTWQREPNGDVLLLVNGRLLLSLSDEKALQLAGFVHATMFGATSGVSEARDGSRIWGRK